MHVNWCCDPRERSVVWHTGLCRLNFTDGHIERQVQRQQGVMGVWSERVAFVIHVDMLSFLQLPGSRFKFNWKTNAQVLCTELHRSLVQVMDSSNNKNELNEYKKSQLQVTRRACRGTAGPAVRNQLVNPDVSSVGCRFVLPFSSIS